MPHTAIHQQTINQDEINKAVWSACDTFRGTVDPSIYKDFILTMLFLEYISDVHQDKYDELKNDPDASAQRIDCVNKKLLVLKGLTLGAEGSATKMNTALNPPAGESKDEQAAANYYSLMVIADTRSKQEAQNANLCTGGESMSAVSEGSNSSVEVEGVPDGFVPVAEGGRLSIEDLFEGVVQFENFPNLTPLS